MYLHLGQDIVVRVDDVVGIFDLENATTSKTGREYITAAQKRGWITNVSTEEPKSFVVCTHGRQPRVYISQISSQTLRKRCEYIEHISNVNL